MRFLESMLFRRTICSVPTNALNKYFASLEKDIRKYPEWKNQYVDILYYVASRRQSSSRFPSDEEFRQALMTRDIYNMQPRSKVYLLEELENMDNEKIVDLSSMLKDGKLTIEHIMPQTLSTEWKEALGTDYQVIHSDYLHTLGNLTLTAYNSKYSNHSFIDKKNTHNGFIESKLTLNKYVLKCSQWGKTQIVERAQILTDLSIQRWSDNSPTYQPLVDGTSTYSLEDDMSFTSLILGKYEFQGVETVSLKWSEMYKQIFQKLYEQDPIILSGVANSANKTKTSLSVCVAADAVALRTAHEISHNVYIELNLSTDRKIQVLRDLFTLYGIDQTELVFTVSGNREEKKITSKVLVQKAPGLEKPLTKTLEKQLCFWKAFNAYAISKSDFMKSFKLKKPCPQNWYDLSVGTSAYHVSLTMNTQKDILSAGLYIEKDKELFHHLLASRDAIEEFLGTPLAWNDASVASLILARRDGSIDSNQMQMEEYFDWYCEMAIKIKKMAEKFGNDQIEMSSES